MHDFSRVFKHLGGATGKSTHPSGSSQEVHGRGGRPKLTKIQEQVFEAMRREQIRVLESPRRLDSSMTAHQVAQRTGLSLPVTRGALAGLERRGLVKSWVAMVEGRSRLSARRTKNRLKIYYIVPGRAD